VAREHVKSWCRVNYGVMAAVVHGGVKIVYAGVTHIHQHSWRYAGQMTVLVVVLCLAVTDGANSAAGLEGPARVMDDEQRVDPCAFARGTEKIVSKFGLTELDEHFGNFDRCDLVVHRTDRRREIDVEFLFRKSATPVDTAPRQQFGSVVMENDELDDGECDRALMLANWYVLEITAKSKEGGELLCSIAGEAALAALPVYTNGSLAKGRTFEPWSLANKNACTGLDSPTLARLGLVRATDTPTFGGWGCEWGTDDRWAKVWFDQGPPPSAEEDGTPAQFGTRNGFVATPSDGSAACEIVMGYHDFTGNGRGLMEAVHVSVGGGLGEDQARIAANDVATNI
jgi:hypothetical protein